MSSVRLDKFLADMGIATRSELKKIIKSGRVWVNGKAETAPEFKLDGEQDRVTLDGKILSYSRFHYYMMDKPAGILTATEDKKQQTVLNLLPDELRRMGLFPVGRLDKDTTGLLLLTDDGEFAHRVISPKSGVSKRYHAMTEGVPDERDVRRFREGILLADGTHCLPAELEISGGNECYVTVMEGKYHQVKRMLAACGKPVVQLRRLSIGGLLLDDSLGAGGFRALSQEEISLIGLSK